MERKSRASNARLIFFSGIVLLAAAFVIPNSILDTLASWGLSTACKTTVSIKALRMTGPNRCEFSSIAASSKQQDLLITASGKLRFKKLYPSLGFELDVRDIEIKKELLPSFLTFGGSMPSAFSDGVRLERVGISASFKGGRQLLQIYRCDSKNILIKGGFLKKSGEVNKIHLLFLLPANLLPSSLSKKFLPRLIRQKDGWTGAYLTYANHLLTATGKNGPLLQASWSFSN